MRFEDLRRLESEAQNAGWQGEPFQVWMNNLVRLQAPSFLLHVLRDRQPPLLRDRMRARVVESLGLPDRKTHPKEWAEGLEKILSPRVSVDFLRHEAEGYAEQGKTTWIRVVPKLVPLHRRGSNNYEYRWEIMFWTKPPKEKCEQSFRVILGMKAPSDGVRGTLTFAPKGAWASLKRYLTETTYRRPNPLLRGVLEAWAKNPTAPDLETALNA